MLIKDKDYQGVLFIHIPKTAGSSISNLLDKNNLNNWNRNWPRNHDPYFSLKEKNNIGDNIFSFSVVRNPYTRAYSCFKQFNKTNNTDISFIEYLHNILNNIVSTVTPLLHLAQSFYIAQDDKIDVNKVYNFENLEEFEKDFGFVLGNYNVGNYKTDSYVKDYTDEAIEIAKEIYKKDFDLFGYSTDFKNTLEQK
jgi:hypothetical protein